MTSLSPNTLYILVHQIHRSVWFSMNKELKFVCSSHTAEIGLKPYELFIIFMVRLRAMWTFFKLSPFVIHKKTCKFRMIQGWVKPYKNAYFMLNFAVTVLKLNIQFYSWFDFIWRLILMDWEIFLNPNNFWPVDCNLRDEITLSLCLPLTE